MFWNVCLICTIKGSWDQTHVFYIISWWGKKKKKVFRHQILQYCLLILGRYRCNPQWSCISNWIREQMALSAGGTRGKKWLHWRKKEISTTSSGINTNLPLTPHTQNIISALSLHNPHTLSSHSLNWLRFTPQHYAFVCTDLNTADRRECSDECKPDTPSPFFQKCQIASAVREDDAGGKSLQVTGNVPREDLVLLHLFILQSLPFSASLVPVPRPSGSLQVWSVLRQQLFLRGGSPRPRSSAAEDVSCWATPWDTMYKYYSQETLILHEGLVEITPGSWGGRSQRACKYIVCSQSAAQFTVVKDTNTEKWWESL